MALESVILEQAVTLTPNDWKHVSWVRDGTSWKSIVDGTQVGNTVTQSTSLGTAKATEAGTSLQDVALDTIADGSSALSSVTTGVFSNGGAGSGN